MSAIATQTTCKIDGCDKPAAAMTGVYARLCAGHRDAQRTAGHRGGQNGETLTQLVRALIKPAQRLDRAREKFARAEPAGAAQAELEEAIRRVQGDPSVANLDRLARATRAARQAQPKREKVRGELDAAEREFRSALADIAKASKVVSV